jgi:hypothetical protein
MAHSQQGKNTHRATPRVQSASLYDVGKDMFDKEVQVHFARSLGMLECDPSHAQHAEGFLLTWASR